MISPSAVLFLASTALAEAPARPVVLSLESLRMEACVDLTVTDPAQAVHAQLLSAIREKCEAVTPDDPVCARLDDAVRTHGSLRSDEVCLSTENVDPLTGHPISAPSKVHLVGHSLPEGWRIYTLGGHAVLTWHDEMNYGTAQPIQAFYANQPGAYLCPVTATALDESCYSLVSATVPLDRNLVISLSVFGNTVVVVSTSVGAYPGEQNDRQNLGGTQQLLLKTSPLGEEAPLSSTQTSPSDSNLVQVSQ